VSRCDLARTRDRAKRLMEAIRNHRGECIPVFHNRCGARTTYLPCDCDTCSGPAPDYVGLYRALKLAKEQR
jgi:hypothetical protein